MTTSRLRFLAPALAIGLVLSLGAIDTADAARRGGSFGSRGARTYQIPRSTPTAPSTARPIDRSMSPRTPASPGATRPTVGAPAPVQPRRGGFFGGLGGGLLGGLMLGGLFGMMMGHGFGGGAGLLALLVQVALIGLVASVAMRLFRRRQPAAYGGPSSMYRQQAEPMRGPDFLGVGAGPAPRNAGHDEIGIDEADFGAFEKLLGEIQTAYGREDYAALRERVTPEVMAFLAEELARNAGEGRRNEISAVRLLQGDLAEAWREGEADYATVAMRYENLDVVRDRSSGAVVAGDPARPIETTEIWTFRRDGGPWGGGWKLSAIQEA